MDLEKIIAELRAERHRTDEAILAIERISHGAAKRRGRRPKWLVETEGESSAMVERKNSPADAK